MGSYDPEVTLGELRRIARRFPEYRLMRERLEPVAARMAGELWPAPGVAETAGTGVVVAVATIVRVAEPADVTMLNMTALLGCCLVDQARAKGGGV